MPGSHEQQPLYAALPPTPPRDDTLDSELDKIIQSLNSDTSLHSASSTAAYNTPPTSSPFTKVPSRFAASPSRKRKRIRFESACDEIPSDPPVCTDDHSAPSSTQDKPIRSILKPFDLSLIHYNTPPSQPGLISTPVMLDSILSQLADTSISARTDAYQLLNNSLRAYKEIPDAAIFRSKLPLLEKHLQRDLKSILDTSGRSDFRFVSLALKVAINLFVDRKGTAEALSDDFVQWLCKITAERLSAPDVPKEIVKNHMYLLSIDSFCSRTLSLQRCTEIVTALHSIHKRVSGAVVQGLRVTIFARLVDHAPSSMLHTLPSWLPIILHAALSSVNDIRSRAIEAGLQAARALSGKQRMADVFLAYCSSKRPGTDTTNFEIFHKGVEEFLVNDDPEFRAEVPRICGMVVLFLRSSRESLEQWQHLEDWMKLLSRCFTADDSRMKMRSFGALNRFIFVLKPNVNLKSTTIKFLLTPILDILERETTRLETDTVRDAAWSSLYLLIYYGFRRHTVQIDRQTSFFWRELVDGVMGRVAQTSAYGLSQIYRVLTYLFEKSTLKTWNEEQVHRNFRAPVRQREVPKIDPSWTRANVKVILNTFDRFFSSSQHFDHDVENEQLLLQAWTSFMTSVHNAVSTEVTISRQSRGAFRDILFYLRAPHVTTAGGTQGQEYRMRTEPRQRSTLEMLVITLQVFRSLPLLRTEMQEQDSQKADYLSGPSVIASIIGVNLVESQIQGKVSPPFQPALEVIAQCLDAAPSSVATFKFMTEVASFSSSGLKDAVLKDEYLEDYVANTIISTLEKATFTEFECEPPKVQLVSQTDYEHTLAILRIYMEPWYEPLWMRIGGAALKKVMKKAEADLSREQLSALLCRLADLATLPNAINLSLAAKASLVGQWFKFCQADSIPRVSLDSFASALNLCLIEIADRHPIPAPTLAQLSSEIKAFFQSERLELSMALFVSCQVGFSQLLGTLTSIDDSQLSAEISDSLHRLLECVQIYCKEDQSILDRLEQFLAACAESDLRHLVLKCSEICKEVKISSVSTLIPARIQKALSIQSTPLEGFPSVRQNEAASRNSIASQPDNEPNEHQHSPMHVGSVDLPSKTLVTATTGDETKESSLQRSEAGREGTPDSTEQMSVCDEHVTSSPLECLQWTRSQRRRAGQAFEAEQIQPHEEDIPSSPPGSTVLRQDEISQSGPERIQDSSHQREYSQEFETAFERVIGDSIGESPLKGKAQSHSCEAVSAARATSQSELDSEPPNSAPVSESIQSSQSSSQAKDVERSVVRLRDRRAGTPSFYEAVRQYRALQASQSVEGSNHSQASQSRRRRGRPSKSATPTSTPTPLPKTTKRPRSKSAANEHSERRKSARLSGYSPLQVASSLREDDATRRTRSQSRQSNSVPDEYQAAQRPWSASYARSSRRIPRRGTVRQHVISSGQSHGGPDGSVDTTIGAVDEHRTTMASELDDEDAASDRELEVPSSTRSTASSQASFVHAFTGRLKGLYEDAKKLFLGDERRADDRQSIEDLTSNLESEVRAATSRKRRRT